MSNHSVIQNKTLDAVKAGSKVSSGQTSRAASVISNGGASVTKAKGKAKKK